MTYAHEDSLFLLDIFISPIWSSK